jgi:hypothetical protein
MFSVYSHCLLDLTVFALPTPPDYSSSLFLLLTLPAYASCLLLLLLLLLTSLPPPPPISPAYFPCLTFLYIPPGYRLCLLPLPTTPCLLAYCTVLPHLIQCLIHPAPIAPCLLPLPAPPPSHLHVLLRPTVPVYTICPLSCLILLPTSPACWLCHLSLLLSLPTPSAYCPWPLSLRSSPVYLSTVPANYICLLSLPALSAFFPDYSLYLL